jgi:interleukin-1 receptor-associated kinase 1
MSSLLRTAQCGDNETTSAAGAVACVASNSPNATSAGGFLQWDKSDNTTCDDLLSSALFAETVEGTSSLEYGVAELGWWVNGTCGAGASEPCAANATCTDVRTPSGTEGHRCACVAGMDGDGFSAGDGCFKGESSIVSQCFQTFVVGPAAPVRHVSCTHKSFPTVNHARLSQSIGSHLATFLKEF